MACNNCGNASGGGSNLCTDCTNCGCPCDPASQDCSKIANIAKKVCKLPAYAICLIPVKVSKIFVDILCQLSGLWYWLTKLWRHVNDIEATLNYALCLINKLKDEVRKLTFGNVGTEALAIVQESTPELSIKVNNDGTFVYGWSDWLGDNDRAGHGTMTGKLDYAMSVNSAGGLDYQIRGVRVNSINYVSDGKTSVSQPTYYILVPANGARVWDRLGSVQQSWNEAINKTYPYSVGGSIAPHSSSAWIDFMTWGADWVKDDRVLVRFRFVNNNGSIDLECENPATPEIPEQLKQCAPPDPR